MLLNKYFSSLQESGKAEDNETMINGDNNNLDLSIKDDPGLELDPDLEMELERIQLEKLKLQQAQLQCKERLLMKQAERRALAQTAPVSRCLLPSGKVVVRSGVHGLNTSQREENDVNTGACSDSTCDACSCGRQTPRPDYGNCEDTSTDTASEENETDTIPSDIDVDSSFGMDSSIDVNKSDNESTHVSMTKTYSENLGSECRILINYVNESDKTTSNTIPIHNPDKKDVKSKGELTTNILNEIPDMDLDSDEEKMEKNTEYRNSDYEGVVDDYLKIVVALLDYPISKMDISQFRRCLSAIVSEQLNAGLLLNTPTFLDYYLNRGAIVCVCEDKETKEFILHALPELEKRMSSDLLLMKTTVKKFILAIYKFPNSEETAKFEEILCLLQIYNPMLRTDSWLLYAKEIIDDVDCTQFSIDEISAEIIRGKSFRNVDLNKIAFELKDYGEVYHENIFSDVEKAADSNVRRVNNAELIEFNSDIKANTSETEPNALIMFDDDASRTGITEPNASIVNLSRTFCNITTVKSCVVKANESDTACALSNELNELDSLFIAHKKKSPENQITDSGVEESSAETRDNSEQFLYLKKPRITNLGIHDELKFVLVLKDHPIKRINKAQMATFQKGFENFVLNDIKNQPQLAKSLKFRDMFLSNGAIIIICDNDDTKIYLCRKHSHIAAAISLELILKKIDEDFVSTCLLMQVPEHMSNLDSYVFFLSPLQSKNSDFRPEIWKYSSQSGDGRKRYFYVDQESLDYINSASFDSTVMSQRIIFKTIDDYLAAAPKHETNESTESKENMEDNKSNDEKSTEDVKKLRSKHYYNVVPDDLKFYIHPVNYPEERLDDILFIVFLIRFEDIVSESKLEKLYFRDIYLFDGAIIMICQNMQCIEWLKRIFPSINYDFGITLTYSEIVTKISGGIVTMSTNTKRNVDEVINLLQDHNSRLRTKCWKKIKTFKCGSKLNVNLQIDKLSAEVIFSPDFNKLIDNNPVNFYLGRLKPLSKQNRNARVKIELKREIIDKEPKMTSKEVENNLVSTNKEHIVNNKTKGASALLRGIKGIDSDVAKPKLTSVETGNFISNNVVSSTSQVSAKTTKQIKKLSNNIPSQINIYAKQKFAKFFFIENKLTLALVCEGYPLNTIEEEQFQRIKLLFEEFIINDLKKRLRNNPRTIRPKFHDIFLSNKAMIIVCESPATKSFLDSVILKFIPKTQLKLLVKNLDQFLTYTPVTMVVPKSMETCTSDVFLSKLQRNNLGFNPKIWKSFSNERSGSSKRVKREFGVDPESLETIRSDNFDPCIMSKKIKFIVNDETDPESKNTGFEGKESTAGTREDSELFMYSKKIKMYNLGLQNKLKLVLVLKDHPKKRINEAQMAFFKNSFENFVVNDIKNQPKLTNSLKFRDIFLSNGAIIIICDNEDTKKYLKRKQTDIAAATGLELMFKKIGTDFASTRIVMQVPEHMSNLDSDVFFLCPLQSKNSGFRPEIWKYSSQSGNGQNRYFYVDQESLDCINGANFDSTVMGQRIIFKAFDN